MSAAKTYRVKSIFGPTLQGEGSLVGSVVTFLRLAGCNRWTGREEDRQKAATICKFCDTDFRGGKPMTAMAIMHGLKAIARSPLVVISGGEPTLQVDFELLSTLRAAGFKLALETNGSRPLGGLLKLFDHITCSPKQSRAETKLEHCHDLKILYPGPTPEITLENFSDFPTVHRFLQAVWDKDYEANLKATICRLYGNPEWRLSLQTHKIVGVE